MPAVTKKYVHDLSNHLTGILGAVELAGDAIDKKNWKEARRMWKLALGECRAAVKVLTLLRLRVMMLRDEGIESQSVAESVGKAMKEAGAKQAAKEAKR